MINTNSPIVQCLEGMANRAMPSFTMGANNMVGIGTMGYNNYGGYYNNNYNNMYNPYIHQQQIRMQEAMRHEEERKQSDMWKMISKKTHEALGIEITEEQLKVYDPITPETYDEGAIKTPFNVRVVRGEQTVYEVKNAGKGKPAPICMQSRKTLHLINVSMNGQPPNWIFDNIQRTMNQTFTENTSKFPLDMSFEQFLSNAGELYVDALLEKNKRQRLDRTQTYNGSDYNQLISMHKNSMNGNPFFGKTFSPQYYQKPVDVSDLEIKLPNHLKSNIDERKAQFLATILNR